MSGLGWSRIRRAFRITHYRQDADSDVDAEIAFHFEEVIHELTAEGMPLSDARREAERRFGSVGHYREQLRSLERGHTAGFRAAHSFTASTVKTMAFALRGLRRSPGVGAAIVATLALGIGVNVAMFRVVDALLLSPPGHIQDVDRLRHLHFEQGGGEQLTTWTSASYLSLGELRTVGGFAAVGAHLRWELVVGEDAAAELLSV